MYCFRKVWCMNAKSEVCWQHDYLRQMYRGLKAKESAILLLKIEQNSGFV